MNFTDLADEQCPEWSEEKMKSGCPLCYGKTIFMTVNRRLFDWAGKTIISWHATTVARPLPVLAICS